MKNSLKDYFNKTKNQAGYSLVEMILVIAIIAILAGSSVAVLGYLRYANLTKVSNSINDAINKLQVQSAAKTEKEYLYIYEANGYLYFATFASESAHEEGSLTASAGTKLCNSAIAVSFTDADGNSHEVSGDTYICIAYNKSYTFATATNARVITVSSMLGSKTITLVMDTGKHVLEE